MSTAPKGSYAALSVSQFPPTLFSVSLGPVAHDPDKLSTILQGKRTAVLASYELSLLSSDSVKGGVSLLRVLGSTMAINLWPVGRTYEQ